MLPSSTIHPWITPIGRREADARHPLPPPPPPLTDTSPLSLSLSLSKSPVSPHLSSSPHTMKSNCRVCCLLPPSPPPKKELRPTRAACFETHVCVRVWWDGKRLLTRHVTLSPKASQAGRFWTQGRRTTPGKHDPQKSIPGIQLQKNNSTSTIVRS